MSRFRTYWRAPEGDVRHIACFEHKADRGDDSNTVAVVLPHAGEAGLARALQETKLFASRLTFICRTARQANDAVKRATLALPYHRRVSLERATAGAWGPTH